MLSDKNYFYLPEIIKRWNISELDIRYCAEHGLIQIQTWLPDQIVKSYCSKKTVDGEIVQVCIGVNTYNGYALISPDGLRNIFRKSPQPIEWFKNPTNDDLLRIINVDNRLMIATEDLVICKHEHDRFEKEYQLAPLNNSTTPPSFAGRPSTMAIVIKEFERRCEQNSLADNLSAEGKALSEWAEVNIDSLQTPKPRTIMNSIRTKYREAISDST